VGNNPTDRGKRGAKMNLLVDGRGAPISVVLTGANRHDKISGVDLIVSMIPKRPAHKEQSACVPTKPTTRMTCGSSLPPQATSLTSRSILEEGKVLPKERSILPLRSSPRAFIRPGGGKWSARFHG
jgi:hypothetical protein